MSITALQMQMQIRISIHILFWNALCLLICTETQSSTVAHQQVPASRVSSTAEGGDSLTVLPFWEGHVCVYKHTVWLPGVLTGAMAWYTHMYTMTCPHKCVCHNLVLFIKPGVCVLVGVFWSSISLQWLNSHRPHRRPSSRLEPQVYSSHERADDHQCWHMTPPSGGEAWAWSMNS